MPIRFSPSRSATTKRTPIMSDATARVVLQSLAEPDVDGAVCMLQDTADPQLKAALIGALKSLTAKMMAVQAALLEAELLNSESDRVIMSARHYSKAD